MNGKQIAMLLGCMLSVGCAGQATSDREPSASTFAIVEHSAAEVSALDPKQPLQIDLTLSSVVHIVEFAQLNDLLNVELSTEHGTFVLGDVAEDLVQGSHRLVLGATQAELDLYFAEHAHAPAEAPVLAGANPIGLGAQARIKLRDCDGCVDPTGIGPVICDDSSPCRGTP